MKSDDYNNVYRCLLTRCSGALVKDGGDLGIHLDGALLLPPLIVPLILPLPQLAHLHLKLPPPMPLRLFVSAPSASLHLCLYGWVEWVIFACMQAFVRQPLLVETPLLRKTHFGHQA